MVLNWISGSCQFCKAIAFRKKHAAIFAAADPAVRDNWLMIPPADGNKKRMIFKPTANLE